MKIKKVLYLFDVVDLIVVVFLLGCLYSNKFSAFDKNRLYNFAGIIECAIFRPFPVFYMNMGYFSRTSGFGIMGY